MMPFFNNYKELETDNIADKDERIKKQREIINRNKICVYLYEFADKLVNDETLNEYRGNAGYAAKTAVDFFEKEDKAAYNKAIKYKSARCLYIYLK